MVGNLRRSFLVVVVLVGVAVVGTIQAFHVLDVPSFLLGMSWSLLLWTFVDTLHRYRFAKSMEFRSKARGQAYNPTDQ